jgi:ATP-dependent Zn protease
MAELQKLDQVPFAALADQFRTSRSEFSSPSAPPPQSPLSSHAGPVKVMIEPQKNPLWIRQAPNRWGQFFTLLLTGGVLYMIYRSLKGGSGSGDILAMMKGTHQLAENVTVTFEDVIGLEEAKNEVRTLVIPSSY